MENQYTIIKRCCKLSIASYRLVNPKYIKPQTTTSRHIKYIDCSPLSHTNGMAQVLTIHQPSYKRMYIAFKGSSSLSDIKNCFDVSPIKTPYGRVHRGFYNNYVGLEPHITRHIREHQPFDIYITGHSRGGAIAMLTAVALCDTLLDTKPRIHCYTFGAPLVGDNVFVEHLSHTCESLACYELIHDIVPRIPLHPLYKRNNATKRIFDPIPKSITDIWANHSCLSYLRALDMTHSLSSLDRDIFF